MVKTKVFVGNLSFKIKENQLVETFAAAGKVAGANIITRGNRSLGYGFVEMESEEEAHEAVKLLSKKELDGRPINVEVAKPRAEGEAASAGEGSAPRRPRAPRAPREPRPAGEAGSSDKSGAQGDGERRKKAPRRRGPRAPRAEGSEGAASGSAPAGERRSRQPRAPKEAKESREPRAPREPKAPREPRPERGPRSPSTSTLFVANLPFNVTDESLAALFKGVPIKSAHVVMKRNGRSKGFGFVDFNTEDDQRKGLQQVDQVEVEGRKVIVKVALTESAPAAGEAAAPAAAPAPAEQK